MPEVRAPDVAAIRAAALRAEGHVRATPLLSSPGLDMLARRRVLVKAECLQPTGSFKLRGGWAAVSALPPETAGILAYSSGNHAQGVAAAAAAHGLPAVILMPEDAPAVTIEATRALGAEVVTYDRARGESRDALGDALARERGLVVIPPFDHPEVIAGQGTIGLEIAADAAALGVSEAEVLVPCGGGGLSSGIALALEAEAPGFTVRTVEPEGFDDMARSLASGTRERNAAATGSVCDALLTPVPGLLTLPVLRRLAGPGLVVTDGEALAAMAVAFRHLRLVLEPGGAVALAALLFHGEAVAGDTVIVVASGGNVDAALYAQVLRQV